MLGELESGRTQQLISCGDSLEPLHGLPAQPDPAARDGSYVHFLRLLSAFRPRTAWPVRPADCAKLRSSPWHVRGRAAEVRRADGPPTIARAGEPRTPPATTLRTRCYLATSRSL